MSPSVEMHFIRLYEIMLIDGGMKVVLMGTRESMRAGHWDEEIAVINT